MLPPQFKRQESQDSTLRSTLSLIQSLVFGLPFLFLLYLQYKGIVQVSGWQMVALAFVLLVILTGLVLLRQVFDRMSAFSDIVKRAAEGHLEAAAGLHPSGELREMAGAFGEVLKKLEKTNEDLSRKVTGLSVMKEMLHAIDSCQDMDGLMEVLLDKSMLLAGAEIGSVFTIDMESQQLRLVRYRGPGTPPPTHFPINESSPVLAHVLEKQKPLLVRNIEKDPRLQIANNPKYGPPSFLSMPIFAGKSFAGVLNLARKENKTPFDKEDEQLISLVVGEMGFALQNAFLQGACQQKVREIEDANGRMKEEMEARKRVETEKNQLASQMIHAQKMQAIGTLAGGIAHDFNNLLMAIQGNVSLMLLNASPREESYERLKSIEKQVSSGAKLTGQLLGFARKGRLEWKPVRLNRVVRESCETFARTRKDVSVHMDLAEDLSPVRADQSQIEQVLWNLFINASDAMPEGGSLYLRTTNVTDQEIIGASKPAKPGKYVFLSVRDTGVGIDPETMKRIFEPFFTTKDVGKGTGLGLASVYGVVKGHGGYVAAKSQVGKGTAFFVYIPASDADISPPPPALEQPIRGTGTILLVDDEESVRTVGEEMLTNLGYKVYSAGSGKQAIEILKANQDEIEVLILDLVMPGLSGVATFDGIKQINPGIKVLLSSGFDENDESVELLKRGCLGFIQKPFSITFLSEVIHNIIKEGKT